MSWLDNTIACSVSIHAWGNSKGVKASTVSEYSGTLADKVAEKQVTMSKKLLNCKEYAAIKSLDGDIARWMTANSVPSMLKNGVYAVPTQHVERWNDRLDEYKATRENLVWAFYDTYYDAEDTARRELGPLYNSADYPSAREVREKFSVEIRYFELGLPGRLERISPQVFQQAHAELVQTMERNKADIEAMLCAEVMELITGLRGALDGLDGDVPRRFHESHITKLRGWSELFIDVRNVTEFSELETVAHALRDAVSNLHPASVKAFATVRSDVKRELDGVSVALKGLMENRPTRQITWE